MEQTQAPLQVGMLLYPGLTLLDLIGPQTVWSWHAKTHLVWKTRDMIVSDSGIGIQPTTTFSDCPHDLDVLFVPGGFGTAAAMQDRAVLGFLAARAAHARYVTSVCSGSLILGAAGLLHGYKATSHWASRDILSLFGAEPVEARVVVDRNRITGGGVTAGIDFGLVLLAKLRGDDVAKVTQLAMEYDPEPPFQAGSPTSAGPAVVKQVLSSLESADLAIRQAAAEISRGMSK
ncbi:MAG TPA: DJ-1/PfpI family protein [Candidatus Binatia bacterium]|jgi:cyclohexyl-isocyanide hydratase|nr:DJ-1/PfpI family protein [Candidatus Binatia bacterium]